MGDPQVTMGVSILSHGHDLDDLWAIPILYETTILCPITFP